MLAIKLQRIGKKHQPSYRIVVALKRSKLGGPPVEDLGSYNSFNKKITLKTDRVSHWLKVGAKPTATIHNLLVKEGAITAPKMKIRMKKIEKAPEVAAPAVKNSVPTTPEASTEATS